MPNYADWSGKTAYDINDNKVGTIADLYFDEDSANPTFATIKSGLFGNKVHFVPLRDAQPTDDGVMFNVTEEQIKSAPGVEDDEELSAEEESTLYAHYQGAGATQAAANDNDSDSDGYDTSGPSTDDAMTRSEEELNVGTRVQETGRVRLKKYVVTENVQVDVPVEREEVRLVREPITEENMGQAMDGPAISEEEHETVLHEEVPVVEKKVVPKERVSLNKEVVRDEVTVDDEVRKEQLEVDDSTK